MAKPRDGKRRLTKEERQEQLLECAINVAAKRGLGHLSHAAVAKQAGVGVPNVFRYFPSRSSLLLNVVDEVGRFYRAQSDVYHEKVTDPRHALYNHLKAFSDSVDTHPDYAAVWLQWSASVQNDCGIWDLFTEHNEYLIKSISRTLRKTEQKGARQNYKLSRSRARSLLGLAFALLMLKFSNASDEAVDRFLAISFEDRAL